MPQLRSTRSHISITAKNGDIMSDDWGLNMIAMTNCFNRINRFGLSRIRCY
jgi:hypothetical protein